VSGVQFDAASITALTSQLTARALVGQLTVTVAGTALLYIANRVPGADLIKPKATDSRVMVSVRATYRSPDRSVPIPTDNPGLAGWVQRYDVAGGLQKDFGPVRDTNGRTLDPLCFSVVCANDPAQVLIATGLVLDFMRMNFDRLDAQSNAGSAPVRFP
jgi:hypothetical protein